MGYRVAQLGEVAFVLEFINIAFFWEYDRDEVALEGFLIIDRQ